jgi:hypothetical protein
VTRKPRQFHRKQRDVDVGQVDATFAQRKVFSGVDKERTAIVEGEGVGAVGALVPDDDHAAIYVVLKRQLRRKPTKIVVGKGGEEVDTYMFLQE